MLWRPAGSPDGVPLVDRAAVARCAGLVDGMAGAELSRPTTLPGSLHGLTALHVAAGMLTDAELARAMLARGARADARDAVGRTAAQYAQECAARHPELQRHAAAVAALLHRAHAASVESGRGLRVARDFLAAGLAFLHAQPGGDGRVLGRGGAPASWPGTTTFTATGASSGVWVEARPPGAQSRGWLHCGELA